MPGATRQQVDRAQGIIIQGSGNVFTDNLPAVRVGDRIQPHHPGGNTHNNARMAQGSSTVFINNIPACRQGDRASCNHVATGSGDVFFG